MNRTLEQIERDRQFEHFDSLYKEDEVELDVPDELSDEWSQDD